VMAALVISISSDLSDESVGSYPVSYSYWFYFYYSPCCTEGGAAAVALLARVLELDTHSSSKTDPSESLLPPVPVAPMVSPFLCSNDSESDTKMPDRHVSSTPHNVMLARWRSRVTSRSSSPTTSTSEILTAPIPPAPSTDIISPIDAPPGIRRRRAIISRLGTRHNPVGHIAPTSSSITLLQEPYSTTRAQSPPASQELWSKLMSLNEISTRIKVKRKSLATTMPSSIPTSGALVPTRANLLPPRKRFME
ncbi:hypothetical protein Tco_1232207, partial [Tanacetum coccineum]